MMRMLRRPVASDYAVITPWIPKPEPGMGFGMEFGRVSATEPSAYLPFTSTLEKWWLAGTAAIV